MKGREDVDVKNIQNVFVLDARVTHFFRLRIYVNLPSNIVHTRVRVIGIKSPGSKTRR